MMSNEKHDTEEIEIPPNSLTILVADDNPVIQQYLKSILRRHLCPCEIDFSENSSSVLQKVNATSYNFILLDFFLRGMNGEELTKSIRNIGVHTPIIMLALSEVKIPFETMVANGVDGIIYKPIVVSELIEEIHNTLRDVDMYNRGTPSKFHSAIAETKIIKKE